MKATLFEIKSWLGPERYLIKATSVKGLVDGLQEYQRLDCLIMMGGDDDLDELRKLDHILTAAQGRRLKLSELAELDVRLSVGTIRCLGVADDGDDEGLQRLAEMKKG